MWDVVLGIVAFVCYFIYDWNESGKKLRHFHGLFLAGSIILCLATIVLVLEGYHCIGYKGTYQIVFGILCLLSFCVLIYTLFFALPMKETYVAVHNEKPSVCDTGMYALCRHPGVLWFAGFYFCLWLAFGSGALLCMAVWFSSLNVAYIILQDYYTFPRIFSDYGEYKKRVPFLFPNGKSLKRCLDTFKESR